MRKVGILALQGDFAAHAQAIQNAGALPFLIRQKAELNAIDGLIIPGGESTTMLKLLHHEGFQEALSDFAQKKNIFGTCAGAILMAREVCNPHQYSFDWIDIKIERNAYGRQIDSQIAMITPEPGFSQNTGVNELEAVFIRAPKILAIGPKVNVLAKYEGYPILVEQGLHMAATFHPELTSNPCIHRFFVEKLTQQAIHQSEYS